MIPKETEFYTYKDYLTFPDDKRLEIIDGHIYSMSSPSTIHQRISMELSYAIHHYIKTNKCSCMVFTAPYDIILKNDDENINSSSNVVIPDISVICDENKLDNNRCIGSPDMIIEIVSPTNASNDFVRKLNLYEKFKVKEYWIVNPIDKNIFVYTLCDSGYHAPKVFTFSHKVKVNTFSNLIINFNLLDL